MTANILRLIDTGAIKSITIKPIYKSSSYGQDYPYEANIRYEWTTYTVVDFKTLEELDRKIRKDLQSVAERWTGYIKEVLDMVEREE